MENIENILENIMNDLDSGSSSLSIIYENSDVPNADPVKVNDSNLSFIMLSDNYGSERGLYKVVIDLLLFLLREVLTILLKKINNLNSWEVVAHLASSIRSSTDLYVVIAARYEQRAHYFHYF
ncbi:unnamed protein product [Vicia faba]|uniref:Uncharacterized protein n=1 Tax=Vicia faba TaxID=3906 RepID=A0AAV0ZU52_VICFA|nr:unnamed protein product [Vicia faba]